MAARTSEYDGRTGLKENFALSPLKAVCVEQPRPSTGRKQSGRGQHGSWRARLVARRFTATPYRPVLMEQRLAVSAVYRVVPSVPSSRTEHGQTTPGRSRLLPRRPREGETLGPVIQANSVSTRHEDEARLEAAEMLDCLPVSSWLNLPSPGNSPGGSR
jgi:hypothetical protein